MRTHRTTDGSPSAARPEPACGPVVLPRDCAAGAEVLPARTIGTEVLVAPRAGDVRVGDRGLEQGHVRIVDADVAAPLMVAGDDGARLVVIIADQRTLLDARADGERSDQWSSALSSVLDAPRSDRAASA